MKKIGHSSPSSSNDSMSGPGSDRYGHNSAADDESCIQDGDNDSSHEGGIWRWLSPVERVQRLDAICRRQKSKGKKQEEEEFEALV
jgi:hypothetical protein